MDIHPSVRLLLSGILRAFPDVARAIAERAHGLGGAALAPSDMMGVFSACTARAMQARDAATALAHLCYLSALLVDADDPTHDYIDAYYVEVLLCDLDDGARRWGWALMPESLRALHIGAWGRPTFL